MKNIIKLSILSLYVSSSCSIGYAQLDTLRILDSLNNRFIEKFDPAGLVVFKENMLYPGEVFDIFYNYIPDAQGNDLALVRQTNDALLNMEHFRYQQTFLDLKVEGAEYVEHANTEGFLVFANGRIADMVTIGHNLEEAVTEEVAFNTVWDYFEFGELDSLNNPLFTWSWEDEAWEDDLKEITGDMGATYYPLGQGQLLWALVNDDDLSWMISGDHYKLAWRFEFFCTEPFFEDEIYVDAKTLEILDRRSLIDHGSADIWYHGSQTIDTRQRGLPFNDWVLEADNNGRDFETKYDDGINISPWSALTHIDDDDDTWGTNDHGATTVHWFVQQSWDYFEDAFQRNGVDGNGVVMRVRADVDWLDNAGFNHVGDWNDMTRARLFFGINEGNYYGRCIDIVGHEFSHGVTRSEANFTNTGEADILNEGFADIFGYLIEQFTDGSSADWLHAQDESFDSMSRRSLSDPKTSGFHYDESNDCEKVAGQPDTYEGEFWNTPGECYGQHGGHINSTVLSHWFYLLVEGGAGVNDNGHFYYVEGIGLETAADIIYGTLIGQGLISSSGFRQCRASTLEYTELEYGHCSNEYIQAERAWYAVGVFDTNGFECGATGLENPSNMAGMQVYPNPVTDQLNVHLLHSESGTLHLMDLKGNVLMTREYSESDFSFNIQWLPSGFYLLQFVTEDEVGTAKFVKH